MGIIEQVGCGNRYKEPKEDCEKKTNHKEACMKVKKQRNKSELCGRS